MTIDYTRMRKRYPIQKRMLTRAVKSGDVDKVLTACRDAVREWDEIGWPDDWSRWQRALDDAYSHARLGWSGPDLRDLG